jgi:hypothetical protein
MAKGTATTKKHSSEVGCFLAFLGALFFIAVAHASGYTVVEFISNMLAPLGIHNTG